MFGNGGVLPPQTPQCNYCRFRCVDPARNVYVCPQHGRSHTCTGDSGECNLRARHPDLQIMCVWTGLVYGNYIASGSSTRSPLDEDAETAGAITKKRTSGRAFDRRGAILMPMLLAMMSETARLVPTNAFWDNFVSQLRRDTRELRIGGIPATATRFGSIPRMHILAFADQLAMCYDRHHARGVLERLSLKEVAVLIRSVCERQPGFHVTFLPPWAFWIAPRGMRFPDAPFQDAAPSTQSDTKRPRSS